MKPFSEFGVAYTGYASQSEKHEFFYLFFFRHFMIVPRSRRKTGRRSHILHLIQIDFHIFCIAVTHTLIVSAGAQADPQILCAGPVAFIMPTGKTGTGKI